MFYSFDFSVSVFACIILFSLIPLICMAIQKIIAIRVLRKAARFDEELAEAESLYQELLQERDKVTEALTSELEKTKAELDKTPVVITESLERLNILTKEIEYWYKKIHRKLIPEVVRNHYRKKCWVYIEEAHEILLRLGVPAKRIAMTVPLTGESIDEILRDYSINESC